MRRPDSGRAVIKCVFDDILALRIEGFSWGEIAIAIERAGVVKPDGQPFPPKTICDLFHSLGGVELMRAAKNAPTTPPVPKPVAPSARMPANWGQAKTAVAAAPAKAATPPAAAPAAPAKPLHPSPFAPRPKGEPPPAPKPRIDPIADRDAENREFKRQLFGDDDPSTKPARTLKIGDDNG